MLACACRYGQEEALKLDQLVPHFVSKYLLPSLRAASTSAHQTCAAYTIQQLLSLLKARIESCVTPEVEVVGAEGSAVMEQKQQFQPEVR